MERRRFLAAIGGGGATLLGGAGFLFLRPTKPVALPATPLEYFTPREFAIFTAIADALIETPADAPGKPHCPTIYEAKLAEKADHYMARNVVDAQKDFHTLLGLFDNALAGFFFCGTTAPFSQMDLEHRRAYLAKWESHSIPLLRSGFIGLKKLTMSCYYASPETWEAIGYPGPMEA
jgi:hypothetical protein